MGRYIEQSDIEDQFGKDNVKVWSDLDGTGSLDAARITRSIEYAEDRIDDYFRDDRYQIPLVFAASIPGTVKRWASILAGAWLYQGRGLRDEAAGERIAIMVSGEDGRGGVEGDLREYSAGIRKLDAALIQTMPMAPVVV